MVRGGGILEPNPLPGLVVASTRRRTIVRKILLTCLAAGALALAASTPASAFVPAQSGIADAATIVDDTVMVKKRAKHRPYGWSRGRKVGWRGAGMPPGQRKKYRR
jgi:hypothetical protein